MEVKEIISNLNERGYLVSKHLLDFLVSLDEETLNRLLKFLPYNDNLGNLKLEDVKKIIRRMNILDNIKYVKKPIKTNENNVQDIISFLKNRLETISKIIYDKIDGSTLTSINKINNSKNFLPTFTVIGIAVDIDETTNTVLLDDGTGTITIDLKNNDVRLEVGEIVAIKCKKTKDRIIGSEVIYPDVPINNKSPFGNKDIKMIFSVDKDSLPKNRDFDVIFYLSSVEGEKHKSIVVENLYGNKKIIDNLSLIDVDGVYVLLINVDERIKKYLDSYADSLNFIKKALKRRMLITDNKLLLGYKNDVYLLDVVPNIIVLFSDSTKSFIYKNVVVVSLDVSGKHKACFSVDVKERKVIKC